MKQLIIIACTISLFSSCLLDEDLRPNFDSIDPIEIGDGTIVSNADQEQIDFSGLKEIYKDVSEDKDLWPIRSLLVYRNGNLVAESYFKNAADIQDQHMIWSCTKQVIGILAGIAVDQNLIESLDDPISKYFDTELIGHEDKADITIRNLLMMQSGIDFNNDGVSGQTDKLLRQIPENSVDFILSRPMRAEPGTEFNYNDGDPHLVSALIQKITGIPTDEWATEVLFSKIGCTNISWTRYKDNVTFGGFGIKTTPRELGKIAKLVANKGEYKGEQIISQEWIEEMTSKKIHGFDTYEFGYFWWIHENLNMHLMWGHGGQFACIIPDKNVTIIVTSIPNTQGGYQISADELIPFIERILDSCS